MNNTVCGKTMENVRNRIDVKLVSKKKGYLKWTSKPSYISHKIFDNGLVAIRKNEVTLKLALFFEVNPFWSMFHFYIFKKLQKTKGIG